MIIGMGSLLVAASRYFRPLVPCPIRWPLPTAWNWAMYARPSSGSMPACRPTTLGNRIGSGLMIGAWEGKLDLMRLFISRGADIDQLNANGESALALAAWRGQLEAVKWLLERGPASTHRIASGRHCITPCFPGMARWPIT